jgi:hypothetical protein
MRRISKRESSGYPLDIAPWITHLARSPPSTVPGTPAFSAQYSGFVGRYSGFVEMMAIVEICA